MIHTGAEMIHTRIKTALSAILIVSIFVGATFRVEVAFP